MGNDVARLRGSRLCVPPIAEKGVVRINKYELIIRKRLGTIEADEKEAIEKAAEEFDIPPSPQNRIARR
jgi:hypothetical protein